MESVRRVYTVITGERKDTKRQEKRERKGHECGDEKRVMVED